MSTWQFDTLSIGSATLDIFLKSKQFTVKPARDPETGQKISLLTLQYGSKMDVDEFTLQSGGGATNTAVGFARLGLRAGVIAEIGHDAAAHTIKQDLSENGVSTDLLVEESEEQTAVSALLIAKDGGRSVATGRGAAHQLTLKDVPLDRIQTNWVHMSSIGNLSVVRAVGAWCKQHRVGLSWNPGGFELKALVSGEIHLNEVPTEIFCVNQEEADLLTQAKYTLETAGKTVIVTNGRAGGKYYQHGAWKEYAPVSSPAVEETGAGDSFITGVVAAQLHDRRLDEAIHWGVKNASSVVQHMGAKTGLLTLQEMEK